MQQHDPLSLGKQYNLGELKAEWKPGILPYVVGVLFFTGLMMAISVIAATHGGVRIDSIQSVVSMLLIWLVMLYIPLTALIWVYQWRARRLFVYEGGLIHRGAPRKIPWTIPRPLVRALYQMSRPGTWRQFTVMPTESFEAPWSEVREVQFYHYRVSSEHGERDAYSYAITLTDGRRLQFDDSFARRQEPRHTIESGLADYQLPGALQLYNQGQRVIFGPLAVAQQGLYHDSKFLPWNELENIEVSDSSVSIRKKGQRLHWAILAVPNTRLLRMLVQHITGKQP
jgi:hypothetical protein